MKKLKLITSTFLLIVGSLSYAQQFNSDNYVTMPHSTGTFVLTTNVHELITL